MSEKTEPATPRRLRRAREQGDSPVSAALSQALVFVVALCVLPSLLVATAQSSARLLRQALAEGLTTFSPMALTLQVLSLCVPLMLACALTAALVGVVQTGGALSFKKLAPDLDRANPVSGLKNIFRLTRLVQLLRSCIAAGLVGYLAVVLIKTELASLSAGIGQLGPSIGLGLKLAQQLAWVAALVGLALAALDVLVTRQAWLKRLRMSPDEIKREHREAEGDPEIKNARLRAHRQMLQGSVLNAVKDATVVIVNPTHLATALKYDEHEDNAPRVVSHGAGELARKIIEAAHAYGVPVVRDVPLARALADLEVGAEIPEELYGPIAEVLREVFERLDEP